jgi:hypothetical protein
VRYFEDKIMSKMIPVRNNGKMPMYVNSVMIPAGETHIFPEHQVPEHLRQPEKVEQAVIENPLQALLGNPIKQVTAALAGLSDDQLDELELLEVAGDDRAGMAKAFQEERLRRADLSLNDGPGSEGSDESNTDDGSDNEGPDEAK